MAAGLYDITNEVLGKGHFAIVKLAKHCLTGEHVAVKIVDKSKLTKEGLEQLSCEIKLWSILSRHEHPNVVKLYQCIDTRTKLYLVMEYCGSDVCDLYDHIQKRNDGNGLEEDEAKFIFRQICQAIFYCHSLKIVHRDLKPENILIIVNKDNDSAKDEITTTVKLIDFGFSNEWCEDEMLRTSCGSLAYSAPEILLGDKYDGPKVDIWALGCILYILLYGRNPFMQFNDNETLIRILDCSFAIPEKSSVSEISRNLIFNLLKKDPNERLSIEQILNHRWLKETNEKKTLNYCGKKESRFKNLVHEHIIDQMIRQGIGVSKDTIRNILKNEHIETNQSNETDKVKNNITDHHYIKATYHLLKDKSTRNSKGIDIDQPTPMKQQKRGILTKRTDSNSIHNRVSERKSLNLLSTTQSLSNLDVPTGSSCYVLPLARKCSIVSEEGSIFAENSNSSERDDHSLDRIPNHFTSQNSIEQTQHSLKNNPSSSIDIFVTDASSNFTSNEKILENHLHSNEKIENFRKDLGIHPVSSSPDLYEIETNNSKDFDLSDTIISNCTADPNDKLLFKQSFEQVENAGKKLNNIRKMMIETDRKKYNSSETELADPKSPSLRVIVQSKSLNNIAFNDHRVAEINENSNSKISDNNEEIGITKMANSISTTTIKSNQKSDKSDCCIVC
ncbi:Kaptin [Sarcoptes scabiei]|nr:Kaptin [Sarcoptes scabiei]